MTSKHALKSGLGALALAATLGLAGCADDTDAGGMSGMDHGSTAPGSAAPSAAPSSAAPPSAAPSSAAPSVAGTPATGPHGDADVRFAQGMVPHHQQAVEMSDLVLAKADADPRVLTLARQIAAAQGPEITQMTGWLEGWGFEVQPMEDMDHSGHAGGGMDGMMSEQDMQELEAASGADASRMFLEGMVKHHEGAVEMAQTELSDGENPDALELAETIVTSQQQEITVMEDLLAQL